MEKKQTLELTRRWFSQLSNNGVSYRVEFDTCVILLTQSLIIENITSGDYCFGGLGA